MNVKGYTSLMAPEIMRLPYLEALLSWSRICDSLTVCYSTFPKMDIQIPEGTNVPWEETKALEILDQFNKDMLNNKLEIIQHDWDPNEPLEDGITKQIAREGALKKINDPGGWAIHFDGDELLRDEDDLKIISALMEDNNQPQTKWHPYALAGILELFGANNKVRFNHGCWLKIRATRNISSIQHGLPLRFDSYPIRGRNPRTGKIIAIENRDDSAGFITNLDYTRPDYNIGIWLCDPNLIVSYHKVMGMAPEWRPHYYGPLARDINKNLDPGVWIYHAGWIDVVRKWKMGWFWDNAVSVLSGKQDTFIQKEGLDGNFVKPKLPDPEQLQIELEKELNRPEIQLLTDQLNEPSVYQLVKDWRSKVGLSW